MGTLLIAKWRDDWQRLREAKPWVTHEVIPSSTSSNSNHKTTQLERTTKRPRNYTRNDWTERRPGGDDGARVTGAAGSEAPAAAVKSSARAVVTSWSRGRWPGSKSGGCWGDATALAAVRRATPPPGDVITPGPVPTAGDELPANPIDPGRPRAVPPAARKPPPPEDTARATVAGGARNILRATDAPPPPLHSVLSAASQPRSSYPSRSPASAATALMPGGLMIDRRPRPSPASGVAAADGTGAAGVPRPPSYESNKTCAGL